MFRISARSSSNLGAINIILQVQEGKTGAGVVERFLPHAATSSTSEEELKGETTHQG